MSLASARSNLAFFAALSDREVLLQARILRIDSEGREVPTLGALLAMGSYPAGVLPAADDERCCSSR